MTFSSSLTSPSRKGEKKFARGRAAELRGDFDKAKQSFQQAAEAFDIHIANKNKAGQSVRPSRLTMAGICFTRLGRNQDALAVFDEALATKEIPDAYLHAGYASAKLGNRERAIGYWSSYPAWADQRIISTALKEQIMALRNEADLQSACEAITKAVLRQDRENSKAQLSSSHNRTIPPKRGY